MSDEPLVSIIIAAHNCENTLLATLQSLLEACNGDFSELEIIALDDASTDQTGQILNDFALHHPQFIVASVAFCNIGKVRAHGVAVATGKYITMLDSDDLCIRNSIGAILPFLREQQPDMLLTTLHEIRDTQHITHQWTGLNPLKISRNDAIRRFLIHKDFQAHLIGQFISRKLYLEEPIPPMTCYEDFYIFPTMLSQANNIYFQRDGHYYYIKRPGSLSSSPDKEKIHNLITCTLRMENTFPIQFHHLVRCHWLDILLKQKEWMTNSQKTLVKQHIQHTSSLRFFLSSDVRLSYKRKALSLLWKK